MNVERHKYFIMTLDPVHVGTGGYRLGRVDNAIVREPGTSLPKIPGTSLHGAICSAAAMRYGEPEARGQRKKGNRQTSLIIYTFGAGSGENGEEGQFASGVVGIHDARILLFPVVSNDGPVWITTATLLSEAGINGGRSPASKEEVVIADPLQPAGDGFVAGWLLLAAKKGPVLNKPNNIDPQSVPALEEALKRTVIVHDTLFGELVNSGLEVRTSVAINPKTGAAEDKALFTYEALPRSTFLTFEVIVDEYSEDRPQTRNDGLPSDPAGVVKQGLDLLEYLGVGGMSTRGFGRIKTVGDVKNATTPAS